MAVTFTDLHTEAGVKSVEEHLAGKSYISGDQISIDDVKVYAAVSGKPSDAFPNASKWYDSVASKLAKRFELYISCSLFNLRSKVANHPIVYYEYLGSDNALYHPPPTSVEVTLRLLGDI